MPSLHETQSQFIEQIFQHNGNLPELILADGLSSAARLDIYRNNTFVGLSKALAAIYPVVEKLVGEDFFNFAAHQFIKQYPSYSGDLNQYGAEFPQFLSTFEPAQSLLYLTDVAALELAHHQAYHSPPHTKLDLTALTQVATDRQEDLRFQLHPSARFVSSDYPILSIWQVNQAHYQGDPKVNLDAGGCQLLVIRPRLEVQLRSLTPGEHTLLQALASSVAFGTACEQALLCQPDYNIADGFRDHIAEGTIVDFTY